MIQVRNIVSDDASEFEDMLNNELKEIDEENLKNIKFYPCTEWKFAALIIFKED